MNDFTDKTKLKLQLKPVKRKTNTVNSKGSLKVFKTKNKQKNTVRVILQGYWISTHLNLRVKIAETKQIMFYLK